ncbi:hypothetical protein FRC02_007940 [Tulasnella sp. 418]|nr:hypothetical protein FRC02_007940 [Tulasnella sp. 418]
MTPLWRHMCSGFNVSASLQPSSRLANFRIVYFLESQSHRYLGVFPWFSSFVHVYCGLIIEGPFHSQSPIGDSAMKNSINRWSGVTITLLHLEGSRKDQSLAIHFHLKQPKISIGRRMPGTSIFHYVLSSIRTDHVGTAR